MMLTVVSMNALSTPIGPIASELAEMLEGEVLHEPWQRAMYATDASSYEILPTLVVLPRTSEDVLRTIQYAVKRGIPITARGGGSGVAGQAIGSGIIIDFSKHLNRVLEINTDENWVRVEPGIYKAELDRYLKKFGKFLPPDPSSSEYCTVGGIISTNGCGPHTVKYGAAIDYTLSLKVALSNGEVITTQPIRLDSEDWTRATRGETLEATVYREIRSIIEHHQDVIRKHMPKVRKNSSGYRLEHALEQGCLDLGKLLVSSEGTLGVVLEAKLRILDIPRHRAIALLIFDDFPEAGEAVDEILKLHPSAVEMLDHKIIELARGLYPEVHERIPSHAKAVLIVEFDGEDAEAVKHAAETLQLVVNKKRRLVSGVDLALDEEEMKRVLEVRKKALQFAYKQREAGRRPIAFIEDTIVDPAKLGIYMQKLYDIYEKHHIQGVLFGHAGDGHIHTRPLIDLKSDADLKLMQTVTDEVYEVVRQLHGSITGEHGDGMVRAEYVKAQYGEEVYELFRRVKKTFDPHNIMNPGKKISDQPVAITANLRYGATYRRRDIASELNWEIKGSPLVRAITSHEVEQDYGAEVELCHGCGYCCETGYTARMCPVFKGLAVEEASCRGRNNILRWLLKDGGLPTEFESTHDYERLIYKYCIQCKMCYVDCPSNVNVGKIMAEARARYVAAHGLPKGYGYFMQIDKFGSLGCKLAPLSNWLFTNRMFRAFMEWSTGIDRYRRFPPFQRKTFEQRFRQLEGQLRGRQLQKEVVFFYDTYINYNNPALGLSIVEILARNGYRTILPPQQSSGMPALVEGATADARRTAEYNVKQLAPYAEKGIPIVCFSPSAGLTLKLEYLNVLDTAESRAVANATQDIHEFLYGLHRTSGLNVDFQPVNKSVLIHLHCHGVVQRVEDAVFGVLNLIPELKTKRLEAGCCGVGGSYGFIKGNFDWSMRMGSNLFEAVRGTQNPVYTTGESCMLQIEQGSRKKIGLTMDLLAEAYGIRIPIKG